MEWEDYYGWEFKTEPDWIDYARDEGTYVFDDGDMQETDGE